MEINYEMVVNMMNGLIKERLDYPKELMGYCCLYGKGTGVDTIRGKRLLEEAAQADKNMAWKFLGDMYDGAVGVPENIPMAVSCYQKAAGKGISVATDALKRYKKTIFGKWKRK